MHTSLGPTPSLDLVGIVFRQTLRQRPRSSRESSAAASVMVVVVVLVVVVVMVVMVVMVVAEASAAQGLSLFRPVRR